MAEEIVRILKVDTKNSGKSIKELRNEIKGLRSELDKAVVGSEEFESTLKQLTQTQKTYNNLQQQIRDMSRTNQQDMVKLAGFAKNLAKSYSAVNAAIGLFSDGNEDIQKTMLKVQRTIQLIQGLSGIQGLIRDLPKVASAFKSWFTQLDPIEKKISNIIKGINGVSPSKLKAINEAGRAGAGASSSATANVSVAPTTQQINAQNQALQDQTRLIVPLNEKWSTFNKTLNSARTHLLAYGPEFRALNDYIEEYNKHTETAKVNTRELSAAQNQAFRGNLKPLYEMIKGLEMETDAFDKTAAAFGMSSKELKTNFDNLEKSLKVDSELIQKYNGDLAALDAASVRAASGVSKLGKAFAAIGKTVGWTLVISAAITLVMKLLDSLGLTVDKFWDFITGANSAAKATKQLNKEISEMTNQNSAKAIVSLRQLSAAYAKLGNDAKAKEKFLVDYANKIKETGLAVDTVKEAEDVFVRNTGKYVDAIKKRAKAQAIEAAVVKLYQEYLDERYDLEQKLEKAQTKNRQRRQQKIIKEIDEADKKIDARMDKLLTEVAELEKDYSGIFATLEATTNPTSSVNSTDWAEEYKKALEALKKYNQEKLDLLKDARTRELDENKRAYEEDLKTIQETYEAGVKAAQGNKEKLLAIENEKNQALKNALIAYEKQRIEIINKYNDIELERQKSDLDRQYSLLEKQIERNRKLYDTSNLKDPSKISYQTQYKQRAMTRGLGLLGLGTKEDWENVYQSKKNIEQQYKDQVDYNNKVYELTKNRVNNEQKLLDQEQRTLENKAKLLRDQLNSTDVNDLDKRRTIADEIVDIENTLFTTRQTIAENTLALEDAERERDEANLIALQETQEKKREALNATLDVVSNLSGAMADMFRMEAENDKNSEAKRKRALKAYKAMAITQAIADTYKGANEAYAAMASIPYVGPALGIAAAAAAIAMGIANVRRIMTESISTSTQEVSVQPPAPVDTAPINYSRNLIGDKELDNVNQPIRCYVLESDITDTQNKVRVTEANATF